MTQETRPPFIISTSDVKETAHRYPNSDEAMGASRAIGRAAGLLKIGLHVQRLAPGERSSWPHAEEKEEEFVLILDGEVDAWIDGKIHRMKKGDLIAFPSGTGICHAILNNGGADALILVGGERDKSDNRIFYPLHPERRSQLPWSVWWDDIPLRPQGAHDGKPDR
jgi:uncharacterized cupin superfamily protein